MNIGTNGHDKHVNVTKLRQIKPRGLGRSIVQYPNLAYCTIARLGLKLLTIDLYLPLNSGDFLASAVVLPFHPFPCYTPGCTHHLLQ